MSGRSVPCFSPYSKLAYGDGDEFVDCKDADCAPTPLCIGIEDCSNGLDDDGDGAIDCEALAT